MKNIHSIEFYTGSKEELLPDFEKDFPYIASRAELDKYIGGYVPWHWHRTVELFYMESGSIEYDTPGGKILFPAGSGGMINPNVLHMTKAISQREKNIQLLHIFDVSLLAGEQGSRIEQKYIAPVITAPQIEVIPLFPGNAEEERILKLLAASFRLSSDEFGYEIKLREALTEIWLMLFELSCSMREKKGEHNKSNDKIKLMMIYIHEHYREKISILELAAAAYLSERECYRVLSASLSSFCAASTICVQTVPLLSPCPPDASTAACIITVRLVSITVIHIMAAMRSIIKLLFSPACETL